MSSDFTMKVGESLLAGGPPGTAAARSYCWWFKWTFWNSFRYFIREPNQRPYESAGFNEYRCNGKAGNNYG